MDVRQLRAFVKAIECRSLSKASKDLGVGQPALGMRLKSLEQELSVPLIRRHSRGVEPTPAGQVLLDHAVDVLDSIDRLTATLKRGRKPSGTVSIGIVGAITPSFLPSLVIECRRLHPQLKLRMLRIAGTDLADAIEDRSIDMALLNWWSDAVDPRVSCRRLQSDRLVLLSPPGTAGAGEPVALAECVSLPLILPGRPSGVRILLERRCEAARLALNCIAEVQSPSMTKALVASAIGHTVMPSQSVGSGASTGRFVMRPIDDPELAFDLHLATAAAGPPSPSGEAVIGVMRTILSDGRPSAVRA
jgi:LysR family nitrogen assimilation transcriptional regulator